MTDHDTLMLTEYVTKLEARIEELENHWISVDDEPEIGSHLLVTDNCAYGACVYLGSDVYECLEGGEYLSWMPTSYQPLPPPPEKNNE